ncbi:hypothetical protein GCM10023238_15560 [Streptomyces heliomycini]
MAYDLDRADWRTFRVDRVSDPLATGARFTPRELPTGSAAEFLRRSMYRVRESYEMVVTFAAPAGGRGPPPGLAGPARAAGRGQLPAARHGERSQGVDGGTAGDAGVRVHGAGARRAGRGGTELGARMSRAAGGPE